MSEEGQVTDWKEGLSEDLRSSPALADFKDMDSMAKGFLDLKSYQGNSIRIPGEDASDEARAEFASKLMEKSPNLMLRPDFNEDGQSKEFFQTLGVPTDADGYVVPTFDVPDGVEYNDAGAQGFKSIALRHNLTKDQYAGIIKDLGMSDIQATQTQVDENSKAMDGLKQEWGQATEDRTKMAAAIADKTGAPPEFANALMQSPNGVKWLYSLAEQFGGEKSQLVNLKDSGNVRDTPAEAQNQIDEIMNNKEHPYWDSHNPGHGRALDKMVALQKQANPEAEVTMRSLQAGY